MAKAVKVKQSPGAPADHRAGLGVVPAKTGHGKRGQSQKPQASKRVRSRTRQITGIALWTVALTLALYLLAYYLLPPPPPSAAVVSLLAFVAVLITHLAVGSLRGRRSTDNDQG